MNTAELYQLLQTKVNRFNEVFQALETNPLNEEDLRSLQNELTEVNDTLVVLKFMVGIPGDAVFQVEREELPEENIPDTDSDTDPKPGIMHEVDAFENAIAEDAETEEPEVESEPEIHEEPADDLPTESIDVISDAPVPEPVEEESVPESVAAEAQQETNERFNKDDNSLAGRLKKSPVSDLKAAIGLNQRFLFSNELFNGNMEAFNRAINELNHLESLNDAKRFMEIQLAPTYEWNNESEAVIEFNELVERRFM
jgi:hypothetical protein